MYRNKKILAIVPARAGSIRLKNKNFLELDGKPLIQHTIDKLLKIKIIDRIIITSDKKNISKFVKKNKKVIFEPRSKKLSSSKSPVFNTIFDIVKRNPKFSIVSYFLPTNPLLPIIDIIKGYKRLRNFNSVISIIEYEDPIEISLRFEKINKKIRPIFKNLLNNKTNSRYLKKSYRPTGCFYISYRKEILKNKSFFSKNKCSGVLYSKPKEYVDINSRSDFEYAKYILRSKKI